MAIDFFKEIIFASDDSAESKRISYKLAKGTLRKIAPRIYTTNLLDSPENIIKRNLIPILGWRFPGCVISHKSASMLRPTPSGNLYITYKFTRRIDDIPGLILNVMQGPGHLDSDIKLGSDDVYASSEERWMLEVLQPSKRGRDGESKGMAQSDVEARLDSMIRAGGEERVNAFRDKARLVAEVLGMQKEFESLNIIVSALLSTHESSVLHTPEGRARATGDPLDPTRIPIFEALYDELSKMYFPIMDDNNKSEEAFRMFSFFESYFSNYIEGTEFEIEEARQIVETGISLPKRTEDSHDILGTFNLLSNRQEMLRTPDTEEEFISLLRHRHGVLLGGREDCNPGVFKTKKNRAGNTDFVSPELVPGTLKYGFKLYRNLREPFAKAIFMMFLCSEVHPFNDGNGRVSRVMMSAELYSAGQIRIIVPTVYREDYLLALRRLSRSKDPIPYIRVMERLQQFSANLWGEDFYQLDEYLRKCNAYEKPENAKLVFLDRLGVNS